MFMLPALAAALMPRVPLAPASRAAAATAAVRTSRPVMLVEVSEAVVQSGLAVVDMPLMTLGDVGLVESVKALPPVAQGVYFAVCLAVVLAFVQTVKTVFTKVGPLLLQAGFFLAFIELLGIPPPL